MSLNDEYYYIAAVMQEERERRGMTQVDLALASGVGVKTISTFETGSRIRSIKVEQLDLIAYAFGLTLIEFLQKVDAHIAADRVRRAS